MNMNEVVNKLRHESATNEVAKAVFVLWGVRNRARDTVTISTLMSNMKEHKFTFPREKYQELLQLLGELGFGRIHRDPKGRIVALTNITFKLQSIARAALGEDAAFKTLRRRARFKEILKAGVKPAIPAEVLAPKADIKKEKVREATAEAAVALQVTPKVVGLTVILGEHRLNVPVADLSNAEISALMGVFEAAGAKKAGAA